MSTIHVEVIDIVIEKVSTYRKMTVTHKHMVAGQSKVDAKAIMDFATPGEVWSTLETAKRGDQFSIDREKDKTGKYWNWVGISRQDGPALADHGAAPVGKMSFGDIDARKQRYIIRQSSLGHAVNLMKESGADLEEILATAEKLMKWVLEEETR